MQVIKNAIVFKTELPSATELAEKIEPLLFREMLETHFSSTGFEVNLTTNELVTEFAGGYSFVVRRDEKMLPQDILNTAVHSRVIALEAEKGMGLTKKEKEAVKEAVLHEMIQKAFPRTKRIYCYYDSTNKRLFVDTSSGDLASRCVSMLVQALGKLETTTLHIDSLRHGIATRLKAHISSEAETDDSFGSLTVGSEVYLSMVGSTEKFSLKGIDARRSSELKEAIENGCGVDAIRFTDGAMDVKLTRDFHLCSIKWDVDKFIDDQIDDGCEDMVHAWRVEIAGQLVILTSFVSQILAMFDAPVAGEIAA